MSCFSASFLMARRASSSLHKISALPRYGCASFSKVRLSIALRVDGTAHDLHATGSEQRLEPILGTHHIGHELGIHIGMRSELAQLSRCPCTPGSRRQAGGSPPDETHRADRPSDLACVRRHASPPARGRALGAPRRAMRSGSLPRDTDACLLAHCARTSPAHARWSRPRRCPSACLARSAPRRCNSLHAHPILCSVPLASSSTAGLCGLRVSILCAQTTEEGPLQTLATRSQARRVDATFLRYLSAQSLGITTSETEQSNAITQHPSKLCDKSHALRSTLLDPDDNSRLLLFPCCGRRLSTRSGRPLPDRPHERCMPATRLWFALG